MTTWRLFYNQTAEYWPWSIDDGNPQTARPARVVEGSGVTIVSRDGWLDVVGDLTLSPDGLATFRGPCAK